MFLQRSGSCRLSLGISISHNFYEAEDLLNILSPHLDRCERIIVRLDGPSHTLKLLPFPGTLSSLRVFDCDSLFPISNLTLLSPQTRSPLEVFISTSRGGWGPETTLRKALGHLDPDHLRVLILCSEWLERMDWVAASRYTELELLEVGCAGETLLWSIEEDSDLPTIQFNRLLKLTLYGQVSGCLIPPILRADSLRHLCIDVHHGILEPRGASAFHVVEQRWRTPHFPNLRSCIIRAQWGFPIELLSSFIKSHRNLIAVELPLCYFGTLKYLQLPDGQSNVLSSLKLLRLRIKQFDMLYLPDELAADIADDLEYLCDGRVTWGFKLEILYSREWRSGGPIADMLRRSRTLSFQIPCEEECVGIPAEDSWNRVLLDGGEVEEVLHLGRRDTIFSQCQYAPSIF